MRLLTLLISVVLFATACGGESTSTPEATPDPQAMLQQVVQNIREVKTFRLLLIQEGAEYRFSVTLDAGGTNVEAALRRGEAQFVSPDTFYANVSLKIIGFTPVTMILFAQGADQWFRLPATQWFHFPFAEGFDPSALIRQDSGFQKALVDLKTLSYVEATTLDDGSSVHHMQGIAGGPSITDLLFGLLQTPDDVVVDVFVDKETLLPSLLLVTQPGTETETEPEPTRWRVELYDINAEPEIEYPEGVNNGS